MSKMHTSDKIFQLNVKTQFLWNFVTFSAQQMGFEYCLNVRVVVRFKFKQGCISVNTLQRGVPKAFEYMWYDTRVELCS